MEVNEVQEQMKAVQRMQEYIEEHLEEEITLVNLSEVSLFSSWHSYRLFKNYLGMTPAEYIRRLRLSHSAMRLKKEQCLVIDAAYDCGFESMDGYTRAFYKEFGCNPGEYVKKPVPIGLFIPYGVKFRELRKDVVDMENLQSVFVQIIRKPERRVIIKRGIKAEDYFDYCAEVNCEVWGILMSMDSLCGEPVCLWLPEEYKKPGTSTYVQGVEVETDYTGGIPDGFDIISLPAAEYLVMQGEPFREEDYSQAILSVQYSLNHYDPSVIGYEWDDSNPRIQLEPRGERGYIEMRAIQKRGDKMREEAIKVTDLRKSYHGKTVVDGLSLSVKTGMVFGLLGANGAGKSTTIECILGTKQADSGEVSVLGLHAKHDRRKLFQEVGVQFQEGDYQPEIKVFELCEEIACLYKKTADWRQLCECFGIGDKLKNAVKSLSGGERQRLFIVLALIPNPKLVFLDELTTGLDAKARRTVWKSLEDLKKQGLTIFLTSHFMDEVEALCDEICILKKGKPVFYGTVEQAKSESGCEKFEDAYLKFSDEEEGIGA